MGQSAAKILVVPIQAQTRLSDLGLIKGFIMQRLTRVNASEETIKIGPLGIRFLLTGDDSNGNAAVFEVLVPAGQK